MIMFMGAEYCRGATKQIMHDGPALAPRAVQKMFPNHNWVIVTQDDISDADCMADRFGDAYNMHKKIYANTPKQKHIFIGGDHSVNFSHFAAIANQNPNEDICLLYFDAHFDIHTPESSRQEASGSPHGTNVRHLLGTGDSRWLSLTNNRPVLKPENLFYFGTRSFEPSEMQFVKDNNIFLRTPNQLNSLSDWMDVCKEVRNRINNKKFIISFDFDGINPQSFKDVWVPEPNGLSLDFAKYFLNEFKDAFSVEFVEWAVSGDKQCENTVKELIDIFVNNF